MRSWELSCAGPGVWSRAVWCGPGVWSVPSRVDVARRERDLASRDGDEPEG